MRFLFAWELGGGLGHMVPLAQIARPLLAAGHRVDFVLRDLSSARTGLADLWNHPAVRLWQAPIWLPEFRSGRPPVTYPELLITVGYRDAKRLSPLACAWRSLFEAIAPDLLLVDHSPTALLAARGFAFPRATAGTGFVVPPAAEPIPPFVDLKGLDVARLVPTERVALDSCNDVLGDLGVPPMRALHQLYSEAEPFLFTRAELDHYRPASRGPEVRFYGTLASPSGGVPPRWPGGVGPRLFAYLKIEYRHTVDILRQLASGPWRTFAYVSGMPAPQAAALASPFLNISTTTADLADIGRSADALLSHGGFNTASQLLDAGVPAIVLPMHGEQEIVGRRLEEAGVGLVVRTDRVVQDLPIALRRFAMEASFRDAARTFAARYAATGPEDVALLVAARCEALAAAGGAHPSRAA